MRRVWWVNCSASTGVDEGLLAVAEPLFQDLVAAEGVFPSGFGDVLPAGGEGEIADLFILLTSYCFF